MTTIATVRPPIQVVWRMSSPRSSPIRRSISSGLMPMRSEPNSPIGTVTSSELTAFVGSLTGRVSWRSRVRFSTRGVPGGSSRSGRAAADGAAISVSRRSFITSTPSRSVISTVCTIWRWRRTESM